MLIRKWREHRARQQWRDDALEYLVEKVTEMTNGQAQVAADLDAIAAGVTKLANAYTNAAAQSFQTQLDAAKKAWEADNEAEWNAAHNKAQGIIDKLNANQPITPPSTSDNPNPEPVQSPADTAAASGVVSDAAGSAGPAGAGTTTAGPTAADHPDATSGA